MSPSCRSSYFRCHLLSLTANLFLIAGRQMHYSTLFSAVFLLYLTQSSLGTVDLGQVYYEPLKDRQGNVLLVTLKEFPNPHR